MIDVGKYTTEEIISKNEDPEQSGFFEKVFEDGHYGI